MQTKLVDYYISEAQKEIYESYHKAFPNPGIKGRLGAIPVVLIDGVLEFTRAPLKAIENLALTILNMINYLNALSNDDFSGASQAVKDIWSCFEKMCIKIITTPIREVTIAIKILFGQVIGIALKPEELSTINHSPNKGSPKIY